MTAVLFDFSGTLCRVESTESWLRATLAATGTRLEERRLVEAAAALEVAGALPGGAEPADVPADLAAAWAERDLDTASHRAAYTGLSRQVPLPADSLHDALYDRAVTPAAWTPYPDAPRVLGELRRRGIAVGVVSNIGWDPRPVFRQYGLDKYVDAYVLSYEHGARKPDPRLFAAACAELGVAPEHTLMVGDSRTADGGAAALGCQVHFVDHLPVRDRPDALLPVLDLAKDAELPPV
ncbi:putative hydrolase of the HAD superfamily [Streptomyces sp. BK022]|uniref:HAD family hydrolase n=1 Tax=Streptomyces sp. BK022 TaxID=2512123 RepID=UPI001029D026|nr:HAD-IA family hydrolase [Streptomyces sp. BK022]RZU36241.1 putative hydrolase of the HAD superfamily [Streptomyces sp. BK022]